MSGIDRITSGIMTSISKALGAASNAKPMKKLGEQFQKNPENFSENSLKISKKSKKFQKALYKIKKMCIMEFPIIINIYNNEGKIQVLKNPFCAIIRNFSTFLPFLSLKTAQKLKNH